jgi:hypothetical protein
LAWLDLLQQLPIHQLRELPGGRDAIVLGSGE